MLFLMTSCDSTVANDQNKPPAKTPQQVDSKSTTTQPTKKDVSTTMKNHELLAFCKESDSSIFTTCHSEKGHLEDYNNGKIIPKELVEKYGLYKFNISPIVAMKYKVDNPMVVVKGVNAMSHNGKQVLIYTVGIELEAEEAPANEGVDTRCLVLEKNGEISGNYFLGGYVKREGRAEEIVCRKLSFVDNQIQLELGLEDTVNEPSHLKLEEKEMREL